MAGGIDWFRWHHGSVTDQKFPLIAKRAGSSVAEVIAVWACLLEAACATVPRGSIKHFARPGTAELLGISPDRLSAVLSELEGRGFLSGQRIARPGRYFYAWTMRPMARDWAAVRRSVFVRDDYRCRYCGSRGVALECDHVVPVVDGGGHDLDNLVTACRPCNRSKGAKPLAQWEARHGR